MYGTRSNEHGPLSTSDRAQTRDNSGVVVPFLLMIAGTNADDINKPSQCDVRFFLLYQNQSKEHVIFGWVASSFVRTSKIWLVPGSSSTCVPTYRATVVVYICCVAGYRILRKPVKRSCRERYLLKWATLRSFCIIHATLVGPNVLLELQAPFGVSCRRATNYPQPNRSQPWTSKKRYGKHNTFSNKLRWTKLLKHRTN